jgi:hypothetical protein
MIDDLNNDLERAQYLQNMLISHATGGNAEERDYQLLRKLFLSNPETKDLLPSFVKTNRDLSQFWQFIKYKFDHYSERRNFIYSEFIPLLDFLEGRTPAPADSTISEGLRSFDEEGVHSIWSKALERRATDPEGAITAARTLLETVCKHILDSSGIEYDSKKIELSELYKLTSTELNLSPSQHTQEVFKQILGGCSGVISGLGTLRNRLGDAHGQGKLQVRPAPRHAELAVNLSGSVALFLVSTFKEQLERKKTKP